MLLTVLTIIGYIAIVAAFFYAFYYAANTFLEKTGTLHVLDDNGAINSKACYITPAAAYKPGALPRKTSHDDQFTAEQQEQICPIM